MSKLDMNVVREQYQQALSAGASPYQANQRLLELTTQSNIESGGNEFDEQKKYLDQSMQLAVQNGADPKVTQERYNDLTTQLEMKKLLSTSGKGKIADTVLAGVMGLGKQTLDVVHGTEQTLKDLGVAIGVYDKDKANATAEKAAQLNNSYNQSQFIQSNQTASDVGEYAAGISQAVLSSQLGGGGVMAQAAKQGLAGAATGAIMPQEGDYEQRQAARGTNAIVGGVIGAAGGALSGLLGKGANAGNKIAADSTNKADVALMQNIGIKPTAGQYVGGTAGNVLDTTYNSLPFSGAKKTFAKQGQQVVSSIDDLMDDLKTKIGTESQAIANVDDIEKGYSQYLAKKYPTEFTANTPLKDGILEAKLNSIIKNNQLSLVKSPEQTAAIKQAQDLLTTGDSNMAQMLSTKISLNNTLKSAFKSGSDAHPILKQIAGSLDDRIDRLSQSLGMSNDYQGLKNIIKRKLAYETLDDIYQESMSKTPGSVFDLNKFRDLTTKALKTNQIPNVDDVQNVITGLQRVINKVQPSVKALKGTTKPSLLQVSGGLTAGVLIATNPHLAAPLAAGAMASRMIGAMLSRPAGIKILESMGKNKAVVDRFSQLITKAAVVETTKTNGKEEQQQ
jgi:hypothetical protein